MTEANLQPEPSSYRDPSGFVFYRGRRVFRQINASAQSDYEQLKNSGLYDTLTRNKLLLSHQETSEPPVTSAGYKVIEPEPLPFISYPYEWCFGEFKDAALLTLQVSQQALAHGLMLKDASAYNVQFLDGRPILIDTLSFERYEEGKPWPAYRQFCEHFLGPLSLAASRDVRLFRLLLPFPDGLALELVSKLLPVRARLKPSLFAHLALHSLSQQRFGNVSQKTKKRKVSQDALLAILRSLESAVRSLSWSRPKTAWSEYYSNYTPTAWTHKQEIIKRFLSLLKPATVWDVGANDGFFSRLASDQGIFTLALDFDFVALEKNYELIKRRQEKNILPLYGDLANPTPAIGWTNRERKSLVERGPADTVMALALVHHLALGHNLSFGLLAEFFWKIGRSLIIEFVPKDDSNAQRLLAAREDIFPDYHQPAFEREFERYFVIQERVKIRDSGRTIYRLKSGRP